MAPKLSSVIILLTVAVIAAILLVISSALTISRVSITREWAIACAALGSMLMLVGAAAGGVAINSAESVNELVAPDV
jgi:hypothetical protein